MRKPLLLLSLTISSLFTLAQSPVTTNQKGNGKIFGVVMDSTMQQPVEFATVALTDPASGKPVDGTICDAKGKFSIAKVAAGNYIVVISFVGFESKTFAVKVSDKKDEHDLGVIKISPQAEILKEVTVEGQKQLIEEKVDRTVYNAENDATTKGGDATDVLKRVPMLSVDLDGNVSMRGNQNVRVLINNKPSTISAGSVADALKQIPADQIKSVEVITSPSAKYDAEGSAGIINIITKKNNLQGVSLNIDAGVGLRGSNLGLNGSYRKGKMGFSLGGFGRAMYNVHGSYENQQLTTGESSTQRLTVQQADTRTNNLMGRYQLGWDYDINKNNYINASVRYGVRNGYNYQDNLKTLLFDENLDLSSGTRRDVKTTDQSGTVDVSLDFTHTYEKPQRELSFSTLYSRNNRTNNFLNSIYNNSHVVDSLLRNDNKSFNQEITLQLDYQTPIGTKQLIEFGAKEIMRKVSSDYKYFQSDSPNGPFVPVTNARATNIFNYDQNVTAGYLSYTLSMGKSYSLKAGARYEYTTIRANFEDPAEGSNTDIPAYGVLVPSINLSKKLKNGNAVKAAFNRRIQRPSIQFLNPNIQASNPTSISFGNPNLNPEYTNNYELSYSTFVKGTSLNFSTFVRNTTDAIQSVRSVVNDSIIQTTYQNIGQENAYGLSIFANVNMGKLSLNGGTDFYYAVLTNNVSDPLYNASNEGWVGSGRLFGSYNLSKGWGFQFFGFYRGRQVQLQGTQGGFGVYSLGLKKDIANKKGSIGFGAENFFTPEMRIKSNLESPVIIQNSTNVLHNLSFRVNFSYRLGKMSFDAPRRKKSVSNDDLKDGGGDNNQDNSGGGQGQQQRGNGAIRPVAGAAPKQADKSVNTAPVPATVNAMGTWMYTVDSPQGGGGKIIIKKEGEAYSGTIISVRNNQETPLSSVTVSGNELSFNYTMNFGGNEVAIDVKGTITGDDMTGTMNVGQFSNMPFTAKRSN